MTKVELIFRSMRPNQWIKNFMIFPAIVFSGNVFEPLSLLLSVFGFAIFCMLSGSIYLYNDIQDVEKDKQHPKKKLRPIASGQLPIEMAHLAFLGITAVAFVLAIALNLIHPVVGIDFVIVCVVYWLLQVAYSKWLKHVVIIDVGVIAAGFVLRVLAGGALLDVPISHWLIICTTLLALFLGFGKRRHELVVLTEDATIHRKILQEYSPYYLDQMIAVVTATTVVAYALYTLDPGTVEKLGTRYLPLTIPFVIYGIFRYLYLVHQKEEGGSPSRIMLTDKPLLVNISLWFVTVMVLLYLP